MAELAPADVIAFWRAAGLPRWYAKDDQFDSDIRDKYSALHHAAARGDLSSWASNWQGALALLILLDQFPRNMFRGSAHAFATDPLARSLSAAALAAGFDQACPADLRVFFYMPLEHSELLADQEHCVALCAALDAASGSEWAKWAGLHRDIIARFGRFPHRNTELGRPSTPEEAEFLASGGFSG